jgi:signal transduction histidine kinase
LRTPLTAIRGNTEILKKLYSDKINDPDFNGMLEDIYSSSIRLIDIVNDFLTTSRLEQGKIEFMKESFNLSLLIKSTLKELDHAAQEKHLTLTYDESVRLTHKAIGDKDRVKEIIINLVGNGLKFTDTGGVTVSASLQDKFVKVTIKDTGRGIPAQNKNLLFRKFQQANNNIYARDTARSTGLGLYISKLMVEAMGGTICLEESEENKGTAFSFTLPADLVSNL